MNNYHQKYDYLIKDVSCSLSEFYLSQLLKFLPDSDDVDTSPLLNMTISIYISSLIHILDFIKVKTRGEAELIANIELTKDTLMKAIESLPQVKKIEYY